MKPTTITESSGNVFLDLGFAGQEATDLLFRSDLMISIKEAIIARNETQSETADFLDITQPRVSDLLAGKIHLFALGYLVDIAGKLGLSVKLSVSAAEILQPAEAQPVALDWTFSDKAVWASLSFDAELPEKYQLQTKTQPASDTSLALAA